MTMAQSDGVSRRDFLARGGAAAAGAALWSAASRARAAGANERLRMGVIGCGVIASHHLGHLLDMRETQGIEVVAACDIFSRNAERFRRQIGQRGGDAEAYTDYRRVLEREDVDCVLIATPEHSHAYLTLDALDAGKHAYVEKPLTHTIAEAEAVVEKVRETGLTLQCGVQGMADDSYASAYEAIRAGKLGLVVQAQTEYVRHYGELGPFRKPIRPGQPKPEGLDWEAWLRPHPPRPWDLHHYHDWRCYSDYSGGIATDLLVHRLTRLLKACGLGFPKKVAALGGIYVWDDGRDLPDNMELLAEYPAVEGVTNGMTVHLLGTMANNQGTPHCIRGTEGTLLFTEGGWEIRDSEGLELRETHEKSGAEDVGLMHRNFHAAIREGAPLHCPAELGHYGVVACVLANEAWRQGAVMHWPPRAA